MEFWKIRRTKLRRESNPARISSSSFGEKFIAFIPAAETDLGFTFVVTFQSTWSFNEISGKLRATRIVVVVVRRPERTVLHPFHFSLETATVSRIYKKYSTLFFDMDIITFAVPRCSVNVAFCSSLLFFQRKILTFPLPSYHSSKIRITMRYLVLLIDFHLILTKRQCEISLFDDTSSWQRERAFKRNSALLPPIGVFCGFA